MSSINQNVNMTDESIYIKNVTDFLREQQPVSGSSDASKWAFLCIREIYNEWNTNTSSQDGILRELVMDIDGRRFRDSEQRNIEDIWGISLSLCKSYCSRDQINIATNFNRIAAGSTSYLLPWLALTAQLSYETGGYGTGVMSLCLGLGSPMLMTISLMITMLNKRWIRKEFRKFRKGRLGTIIKHAEVIAEAAQQEPARISKTETSLVERILQPDSENQWGKVAKDLKNTRWKVTLSLVAQLSVAIISWILTAVGSLITKVGDTEEALVLSSGALWIWLVPVILGWILVGTQNSNNTMSEALESTSSLGQPVTKDKDEVWLKRMAGFQKQQGPAFNYARTLTWITFVDQLRGAFRRSNEDGSRQPSASRNNPTNNNNVPDMPHCEYSNLGDLSAEARDIFGENIVFSILMGILIQWSTTILAFILAYETVVKGLGCRSGSYLIYGMLSTAACFLLLLSATLSHFAMRNDESRQSALRVRCAVTTRLRGCFFLIANTAWLLLISIWELIGFFDSCYCASTELSKKEAGWVLLFKGADALKEDAQAAWGVGIGLGFFF
ncbi:hypothetical protein LX36DRAFT_629253 [Colletotrichum falcatum]|nr:hypothetical protein LX36DRAFT_629253 [Colletotrichum falcatum]